MSDVDLDLSSDMRTHSKEKPIDIVSGDHRSMALPLFRLRENLVIAMHDWIT